jgi:short subunit dehydrogenase-like uncharacterized protein
MTTEKREFDLIIWGASGFTGKLTAEYLLGRYGIGGELNWAIGGRNQAKLEAVRKAMGEETGVASDELPIIVGDSQDESFLAEMVARTKVVCSTVGPYALYGSKLVAACSSRGTHYCDLTGEAQWMQRMIDAHHDTAVASGARIVFTCGFDCIPSDIGAFFLQQEMQKRHGVPCSKIQFRVVGFSGAASGGTIASMMNMMEEAAVDPSVMLAMNEPYALNPKGERSGPDQAERKSAWMDNDFGQWVSPFLMGAINTKVVRRSNAIMNYAYGKDFRYDEAVLTGSGAGGFLKGTATAVGSMAMMGAMSIGPIRRVVSSKLPAPGQGPSKDAREAGYFNIKLRGEHPSDPGKTLNGRVTGDRDPGYGSTSKMLGESAVCLALDTLTAGGGMSTPAAAMGDKLLTRLVANSGLTFDLE